VSFFATSDLEMAARYSINIRWLTCADVMATNGDIRENRKTVQ